MKRFSHIPILLLCLTFLSCEEGVDAIIGDDRPYTIWGLLDAGADTQRVRVIPITTELGLPQGETLDAKVFSVNLDTGERIEWEDKFTMFPDSSKGHVFWSAFTPDIKSNYQLEVVRSDGQMSSSTVALPDSIQLFGPDNARNRSRVDMRIIGTDANIVQARVNYQTFSLPPVNPFPPGSPISQSVQVPFDISYREELLKISDGFEFQINMARDFGEIVFEYQRRCLNDLTIGLGFVTVTVFVGDPSWLPPGGEFNERILAQPGALSNVENGLGFVGAGYSSEFKWFPSNTVRSNVGFALQSSCGFMPADIPECVPQIPCGG